MDKPELKPCPFCGNPAKVIQIPDGIAYAGFWTVGCDTDFMCLGNVFHMTVIFTTKGEAAEAWNRRVDSKISVGDKVYQTDGFNTYESTVKRVLYDTEKNTFDADAIGQSIFLTREEAEKRTMHLALEEAENHDEKS